MCTKCLDRVDLISAGCKSSDFESQSSGELHSEMSETSDSEHTDFLSLLSVTWERSVYRDTSTKKWRSSGDIDTFWDRVSMESSKLNSCCVASEIVEVGIFLLSCKIDTYVIPLCVAVFAGLAGVSKWSNSNDISNFSVSHIFSNMWYSSYHLMTSALWSWASSPLFSSSLGIRQTKSCVKNLGSDFIILQFWELEWVQFESLFVRKYPCMGISFLRSHLWISLS